jgi:uncharacterized protein YkwD
LTIEQCEERVALSITGISNFDQLLVELINRARANPQSEAGRYNVALNQGLAPGTISIAAKEPLAPHQALMNAAGLYSNDMLARNFFDHTDPEGNLPWDRTEDQGYPTFAGVGENIAWGTFIGSREQAVHDRHRNLFLSPGHRENMLNPSWMEIGTGVTFGETPYQSVSISNVDVSIVTENFGGRSGIVYLTGVAFHDQVDNDFYDVGEGLGSVAITATNGSESFSTTSATSGGYALQLPAGTYTVTAVGNGVNTTRTGMVIGSDNVKLDFQPSPATPPPPTGQPIGETGRVNVAQTSSTQWHRVNLSRTYVNPVVVMGPVSYVGFDPALVRVRNITTTSFEWQIDEWDYLDGAHAAVESVGYLVVEAGTHTLAGGHTLVAGSVATDHQFRSISLAGFNTAPAILTTVTSAVGGSAVTTRIRNATANGFEVRLQEEERNDDRHAVETIGYVAIRRTSGTIGNLDFISGNTGSSVSHTGTNIQFGSRFTATPVFLGNVYTYLGTEPVALRTNSLTASSARVFLQEEQSLDTEIVHPSEDVSYLAIEAGVIYATESTITPSNAPPNIDNQTFSMADNTANGAIVGTVVATDADAADSVSYSITAGNTNNVFALDATSGRLTVADRTGLTASPFQLTIRAQDSRGAADTATVTVNVTSTSILAVGEAGTITASQSGPGQWYPVQLQRAYVDPIVVVGPLSFNGSNPSTVRVRNVTSSSFEWQIDEWDYLDGIHTSESAGYLVIEAGNHVLSDGTRIVAGRTYSDHRFAPVILPGLTGTPIVLSTVASTNGGTAVVPRIRGVQGAGFEIRIQEEQASDGTHAIETVNYVAMEQAVGTISSRRSMSGLTPSHVFHVDYAISFGTHFTSAPVFLANIQTYLGSDPAGMRRTFLDRSGARIFLEEEQSADAEMEHAGEAVGFLAIETGLIDSNAGALGVSREEVIMAFGVLHGTHSTNPDASQLNNSGSSIDYQRRSSELDQYFVAVESNRSPGPGSFSLHSTDVDRVVLDWSCELDTVELLT